MALNWNKFAETALTGVGNQMSVNYNRQQEELRENRKMDRVAQTDMNKMKAMDQYATEKETRVRKEREVKAAELGLNPGTPEYAGFVNTGNAQADYGLLQGRKTQEQQTELDMKQRYSQENAKFTQGLANAAPTAADKNAAAVDKIIANAPKDANGEPKLTPTDKLKLAARGVDVPGAKKELTGAVKKDIWKVSQTNAKETYSPDNLDDDEAINEANTLLAPTGRKVKDSDQARKILIENETMRGYQQGTLIITGAPARETPTGKPVPEAAPAPAPEEEAPKGALQEAPPEPYDPDAAMATAQGNRRVNQLRTSGSTNVRTLGDKWKENRKKTDEVRSQQGYNIMGGAGNTSGR